MSVDWSKYPPLPEAPKLPEWRDTPEREAYWAELCEAGVGVWGCWIPSVLWILFSAAIILKFCYFRHVAGWAIATQIMIGCFVGLLCVYIPWTIFNCIFSWIAKRKISRKYGFSMSKLNRPDISKEIGEALSLRPDFDEAEFGKYWQSEEQIKTALNILKMTDSWYMHKKMLYPNDPLLMLFYGRQGCSRKEKMIDPDYFFEDVFLGYDIENFELIDNDTTLAELVECCMNINGN
ncbi:MAG: hypothetical protein E7039_00025 [Lentisphaerae bacterium]|nr:hypothetical protein [Lentisphaerota bacterium]